MTFGDSYLGSPVENFIDNLRRFPVLLPVSFGADAGDFPHLRLHNGTIWRWNRLLVGSDANGMPHLRIEHRVMPAGPTIVDMMANVALYLGAVRFLAGLSRAPELELSFAAARENFYRAARFGMEAEVDWMGGGRISLRELLREELIPMAREGLKLLGIDIVESERYLGILRGRVESGQNGAFWQKSFAARHGRDFFRLTAAYLERQRSGMPVHEWEI